MPAENGYEHIDGGSTKVPWTVVTQPGATPKTLRDN
jgi:hypothetical protein